jgi:hypothetical protein
MREPISIETPQTLHIRRFTYAKQPFRLAQKVLKVSLVVFVGKGQKSF